MQLVRKSVPGVLAALAFMLLSASVYSQQFSNESRQIVGGVSIGIGVTNSGDAGVLLSPSFILKSRILALTLEPLNLIFSTDRSDARLQNSQGDLTQCNDVNPSHSGNAACPRIISHWSAVADIALRIPKTEVYTGAGVAVFNGRTIPVGTFTAHFRQATNNQWLMRGVLGDLYLNFGVGLAHTF